MNNREILDKYKVDYLLVNSSNEFLDEYSSLDENSAFKVTNFSGSTADVIITPDTIFLFVDGRYHIQADNEVNHDFVKVVKLQVGQNVIEEIARIVGRNKTVGLFSKKNSQYRVEQFSKYFDVELLDDDIFTPSIPRKSENIETISGLSAEEKTEGIREILDENEAIFVTNPQEVSYLFNLRCYSKPYSSSVYGKALIFKNEIELFTPENFDVLNDRLMDFRGKIYIDKKMINAFDYNLIREKTLEVKENPIAVMKSVKTDIEIEHLKSAFARADKAVLAVREFIEKNDNLSEADISAKLEDEFLSHGAKSLSFKSIVAKDKNSALAHYAKASKEEVLQDGSLILIDCGAYYEQGLATDCTRVFVKGTPTELQKKVYTTVLKCFLNCFATENITTGGEIDAFARAFFMQNSLDGFVFNHGLGHGIGISVHENPPALNKSEAGKVKLKNNMCFTIEPGLYNKAYFGIRLENSCFLKDNEIVSFSKLPFENKLINYSMLDEKEKVLLDKFGVI